MNSKILSRTIVLLLTAFVVSSCSPSIYLERSVSYDTDDMYATHDRNVIAQKQEVERNLQRLFEAQRMEEWARILGLDIDQLARQSEEYDTPYGERLRALSADEYTLPASYNLYKYEQALETLAQYDPTKYTASIDYDGNLSIEPKYISSIYGVWNSPFYDYNSWYYGYHRHGYPAYGYYSMWGYPRSNYGFGVGFGYTYSYYNPWWGGYPGYFDPLYSPFYSPFYYPFYSSFYAPYYYPYGLYYYPYNGGGGRKYGTSSIVKRTTPYNSKESSVLGKRRSDGSTVGSTSSSSGSYNRSATTYKAPTTSTPSTSTPTIQRNSIGR